VKTNLPEDAFQLFGNVLEDILAEQSMLTLPTDNISSTKKEALKPTDAWIYLLSASQWQTFQQHPSPCVSVCVCVYGSLFYVTTTDYPSLG
jgi:hypothetical protein